MRTKLLLLATASVLLIPQVASAQVRFVGVGPTIRPVYGPFSRGPVALPYTVGGFYGGYPGFYGGYPGFYGGYPGFYGGYSSWYSAYTYTPLYAPYTYPGYPVVAPWGYAYSGPIMTSAWMGAGTGARMRPTLHPAVHVDPSATKPTPLPPGDGSARVDVRLPAAGAEVWFQGVLVGETGVFRQFVSPPLSAGSYTYDIRIRWRDGSGVREESRSIKVRAGDHVLVDFTS